MDGAVVGEPGLSSEDVCFAIWRTFTPVRGAAALAVDDADDVAVPPERLAGRSVGAASGRPGPAAGTTGTPGPPNFFAAASLPGVGPEGFASALAAPTVGPNAPDTRLRKDDGVTLVGASESVALLALLAVLTLSDDCSDAKFDGNMPVFPFSLTPFHHPSVPLLSITSIISPFCKSSSSTVSERWSELAALSPSHRAFLSLSTLAWILGLIVKRDEDAHRWVYGYSGRRGRL